jgi:hypothetical protein
LTIQYRPDHLAERIERFLARPNMILEEMCGLVCRRELLLGRIVFGVQEHDALTGASYERPVQAARWSTGYIEDPSSGKPVLQGTRRQSPERHKRQRQAKRYQTDQVSREPSR